MTFVPARPSVSRALLKGLLRGPQAQVGCIDQANSANATMKNAVFIMTFRFIRWAPRKQCSRLRACCTRRDLRTVGLATHALHRNALGSEHLVLQPVHTGRSFIDLSREG